MEWKQLEHAYGDARDIPKTLRYMCSSDPYKRLDAYDWLTSCIWHGGKMYQATASVIPFLVEILETKGLPCRGRAATLLAWIARSLTENNERYVEEVKAAMEATIPVLLDCYTDSSLSHATHIMILAILSQFPQQRIQILEEVGVDGPEKELLAAILSGKQGQIAVELLHEMGLDAENDPELAVLDTQKVPFDSQPKQTREAVLSP